MSYTTHYIPLLSWHNSINRQNIHERLLCSKVYGVNTRVGLSVERVEFYDRGGLMHGGAYAWGDL